MLPKHPAPDAPAVKAKKPKISKSKRKVAWVLPRSSPVAKGANKDEGKIYALPLFAQPFSELAVDQKNILPLPHVKAPIGKKENIKASDFVSASLVSNSVIVLYNDLRENHKPSTLKSYFNPRVPFAVVASREVDTPFRTLDGSYRVDVITGKETASVEILHLQRPGKQAYDYFIRAPVGTTVTVNKQAYTHAADAEYNNGDKDVLTLGPLRITDTDKSFFVIELLSQPIFFWRTFDDHKYSTKAGMKTAAAKKTEKDARDDTDEAAKEAEEGSAKNASDDATKDNDKVDDQVEGHADDEAGDNANDNANDAEANAEDVESTITFTKIADAPQFGEDDTPDGPDIKNPEDDPAKDEAEKEKNSKKPSGKAGTKGGSGRKPAVNMKSTREALRTFLLPFEDRNSDSHVLAVFQRRLDIEPIWYILAPMASSMNQETRTAVEDEAMRLMKNSVWRSGLPESERGTPAAPSWLACVLCMDPHMTDISTSLNAWTIATGLQIDSDFQFQDIPKVEQNFMTIAKSLLGDAYKNEDGVHVLVAFLQMVGFAGSGDVKMVEMRIRPGVDAIEVERRPEVASLRATGPPVSPDTSEATQIDDVNEDEEEVVGAEDADNEE